MTVDRLSALDASFLYAESSTMPLHVAMTVVFDPTTLPGGYSFSSMRDRIERRIAVTPVFRRRLVEVPLRLGHPIWVDDPDFDLDNHLHRGAIPSPGGPYELAEFTAEMATHQLHRDRPLWEMWLVEGLADGNVALVAKMHHSTVDGMSGAALLAVLFDVQSDAPDIAEATSPLRGARYSTFITPSDLWLVAQALAYRSTLPVDIARTFWRSGLSVLDVRRIRKHSESVSGGLPLTAPRTSINASVSTRRRVAFAVSSLADVKRLKNAIGTSVNDVILAICTGVLRSYLTSRDELPERPLVSVVPVSVAQQLTTTKESSNKISGMFVQMPTNEDDPLQRLKFIHEGAQQAKDEHSMLGPGVLQDWAELADPMVFPAAARLYQRLQLADHHPPVANLLISNVAGPDFPLYLGGARMLAGFPFGPVIEGMGLNVTIMSYCGVLYWGFISCSRSIPDVWALARYVPSALQELLGAAGVTAAGPGYPLAAPGEPRGMQVDWLSR